MVQTQWHSWQSKGEENSHPTVDVHRTWLLNLKLDKHCFCCDVDRWQSHHSAGISITTVLI